MIPGRLARWLGVLLLASGCVATSATRRVASLPEAGCKHCNCLMPAGVDPQATCPVCHCGRRTHQCVRGR